MKPVVGVVVGGLLAFAIACGGSTSSAYKQTGGGPPPVKDGGMTTGATNPRAELERLDQQITVEMQKLGEARPNPPVGACEENCAQPMATQATQAKQADPTCPPPKSETCTQSCTLKSSICENASKICTIASDLGGNDAYANETCNRGLASCEAAKKRCCSCM